MPVETWAKLVPELACSDLPTSLAFYCEALGFQCRFFRPEDGFAYLDWDGAQIMLEQQETAWRTADLEKPYGRGINLQIEVEDVGIVIARLKAAGITLFQEAQTAWYREDAIEHGQIECLVQDPDGYLLRFIQPLGTRPAQEEA